MFSRLCYGLGRDMPFNYSKFICDYISDLSNLPTNSSCSTIGNIEPCAIGSLALVIENQSIYILSNQNIWSLLKKYDGESILDTIDIATLEEVKEYIG